MNKNNENLIGRIKIAYFDKPYPVGNDYFKAVAESNYQDYFETKEKKTFWELDINDFKRNYDFLFFLDGHGVAYYIPAYMISILTYEELICHPSMDCLLSSVAGLDCDFLSKKELLLVMEFLELFESHVDVNEDLLADALKNINHCMGFRLN